MIEVDNLHKSFGSFDAVKGLSFKVDKGEICGFLGPNGAGKTTTMRIMATLDLPTSGSVQVNGRDVVMEPGPVRKSIGYMPDYYGTYPSLIVCEYLDFFARSFRLEAAERKSRIKDVSYFTELDALMERPVEGLSKGQKQRLSLARALLPDPKVLILDEPAAGLDPRARIELRELLKLLAEDGKTIFISSHILTELNDFITKAVVIDEGNICYAGDLSKLQKENVELNHIVVLTSPPDAAKQFFLEQQSVTKVSGDEQTLKIHVDENVEPVDALIVRMIESGIRFSQFYRHQDNLEDVFLAITKKGNGS